MDPATAAALLRGAAFVLAAAGVAAAAYVFWFGRKGE